MNGDDSFSGIPTPERRAQRLRDREGRDARIHGVSTQVEGLRAAVEALADEAKARKAAYPSHPHWSAWDHYESDLRDALAATASEETT